MNDGGDAAARTSGRMEMGGGVGSRVDRSGTVSERGVIARVGDTSVPFGPRGPKAVAASAVAVGAGGICAVSAVGTG